MKIAIWKIPDWKPSIQRGERTGGENLHIACKILEGPEEGKTIYLNLDTMDMPIVNKWMPYINEGNVLEVTKGGFYDHNKKKQIEFIDKTGHFMVIKQLERKV